MALPQVNPEPNSDSKSDKKSDESRGALAKIFSKDISRQVLQKNITEGQLDLKTVLVGMSKTLDEMVKMDRDALKRMREQAGFQLEGKREGDKDQLELFGDKGSGKDEKEGKKGLLSSLFKGLGGIFKGLGGLGAGLLKSLGMGSLLGGGFKAGLKALFTKKFVGKMLTRFAIPGLILTYSKDIGNWLEKEFKGTPVEGLFAKSKLGSQSIATYGLQGGAAAAMIFGPNPVAILIGTAAGLAVGAAVHITDWMRDRANKTQKKIKADMDKAMDKSADVEGAAETERKKTGKVSKKTETETVAAQKERTKRLQRVMLEAQRAQGSPNVFEASQHQTGLKMDTKKPDSTAQDKQAYDEAQRVMAKIRGKGYFDNPPDIIKEDARFLRFLINTMQQGWAHRYFGGDHKKALALWKQMMETMDFLGKNAPAKAGASGFINRALMKNMKDLEKFHAMAPEKQTTRVKNRAKYAADQIQKSINKQKGLAASAAKKGLTDVLMGGNIEASKLGADSKGAKPKPVQTLGSASDWMDPVETTGTDLDSVIEKSLASGKTLSKEDFDKLHKKHGDFPNDTDDNLQAWSEYQLQLRKKRKSKPAGKTEAPPPASADVSNKASKTSKVPKTKAEVEQKLDLSGMVKGRKKGPWTIMMKGIMYSDRTEEEAKEAHAHGLHVEADQKYMKMAGWLQKSNYETMKHMERTKTFADDQGGWKSVGDAQRKFIADYEAGKLPHQTGIVPTETESADRLSVDEGASTGPQTAKVMSSVKKIGEQIKKPKPAAVLKAAASSGNEKRDWVVQSGIDNSFTYITEKQAKEAYEKGLGGSTLLPPSVEYGEKTRWYNSSMPSGGKNAVAAAMKAKPAPALVKDQVVPPETGERRRGTLGQASYNAATRNSNINTVNRGGDNINNTKVVKQNMIQQSRSKDTDQDRNIWWSYF